MKFGPIQSAVALLIARTGQLIDLMADDNCPREVVSKANECLLNHQPSSSAISQVRSPQLNNDIVQRYPEHRQDQCNRVDRE